MREIKFRAWDKKTHSIRKISTIHLGFDSGYGKAYYIDDNLDTNHCGQFKAPNKKSIDCILMQYTGLKDKNGLDIYEGDIIKGDHCVGGGFIKDGEVEFNSAAWAIKGISYLLR